mgnify:CR=1 FL=1
MIEKTSIFQNDIAFNKCYANVFVKQANRFESTITVKKDDTTVDGKSLLGLLTLNLKKGEKLSICAKGADEQEAAAALVSLVENWFTVCQKSLKNVVQLPPIHYN